MSAAIAELHIRPALKIAKSPREPRPVAIVELRPIQYSAVVDTNLVPLYQQIAGELTKRSLGTFYILEASEPVFLAGQAEPNMRRIEYRGDEDWTPFVDATNHAVDDETVANSNDTETAKRLVAEKLYKFFGNGVQPVEIPNKDHSAVWDI